MKADWDELAGIAVGDPVEMVKKRWRVTRSPKRMDDPDTPTYYELPGEGISVFFDRGGKTETVHYESPFAGRVEGVAIGDSKDVVRKKKGKPDRKWPVADGIDRWIYEKDNFLRVDFSPKTGLVDHIFK